MDIMLAYCGLSCETCPIHLATSESNKYRQQTMRHSIAEECRNLYGMNFQTEDIKDCDGCRANTGRIFSGCLDCEIRKCARMKGLESCAFCGEYACNKLLKHFAIDSSARLRLEEIRLAKSD